MRILLLALLSIILITSCDDGDVVVTNFDFDGIAVQLCADSPTTDNQYVFYKINPETNETLLLTFQTDQDILNETGEFNDITLSETNIFEYRRYSDEVPADFFCSTIPPSSPAILEVITADGGVISLRADIGSEDDNDELPANLEGVVLNLDGTINDEESQDTDRDGIPDYKDADDDGDNVLTVDEVMVVDNQISSNSPDTDNDGTLDYLDCDDDEDGIPTIQEDIDRDLDPSNDMATTSDPANYLLQSVTLTATPAISESRANTFQRTVQLNISLNNLVFNSENASLIEELFDFGSFTTVVSDITSTPMISNCP